MPAGVLAKLSRPKLYGAVPRARLFQRLDEMREHPAIWVCGPPGAGKTTLVASYASERAIPGIWYQVDAGDGDPATFFYYLGIALEQAVKSKHRPLPLLTPELQGDLDRFSRRYFRELFGLLPERALLILDNVQEAVESALHSVFESLIEEIPENLNVICMSRTDPPTAFARYTSTGHLAMLEWTDLRLTLEETRQIAAVKQPIAEPTLLRLLEQSEGWAAGVTLMLERIARTGEVPETIEAETREAVFNYFAGTLFDKQAADTRQVLLRTAFLPQITASAAEALTGNPNAGKLLEYLHRRHLFTYRHRLGVAKPASKKRSSELEESTYEYHALFRDFLLAKAQEEYTQTGLRRLLQETGQLLESIELEEEAIALYRRAEDWDSLTGVLLKQAPCLLRQGRAQTLREWITAVPAPEAAARPWVSYWFGVSLIPVDQLRAIDCLERAFERFQRAQDTIGQIACAARIIESIYHAYINYEAVERWIEVLDALLGEDSAVPDADIELRAHCSLLQATFACRPHHPRLGTSVERISRLLAAGMEPAQVVTAGDALLRRFDWAVDVPSTRSVIQIVEQVVEDKSVAPLVRLYWWARVGFFYMHDGRYALARAALGKADEIAVDFGSHTSVLLLDMMWVFLHTAQRETAAAAHRVQKLLQCTSAGDSDLLFITWAQSLLTIHTDTLDRAIKATRAHLQIYMRIGPFFAKIQSMIQLAALLAQAGELEQLERLVDSIRAESLGTYMSHVEVELSLVQAFAQLRLGQESHARAFIECALALDVTTDLLVLRLIPGLLASAFGFALREGIGAAKIKQWIVHYQIVAEANAPEHWPWAVRLHVLGSLRLECRDQPVQFKRKAPQKPLELLMLLAAAGPEGLVNRAIADRLWPDLEADSASANVDTNVYRLRKVLAVEDALISANGRVSLNPARCWVDAWYFERLAAECVDAPSGILVKKANEALLLYQGHFLNSDLEQPWALAFRERLAQRLVQLTETAGRALEHDGAHEQAIELYRRSLALDNLSEPIYRRLIACLRERGDTAEAMNVYRRCRELLSVVLGVQPSAETQALVETLRQ
jgi:DNA-binding SARP family transcriptional activator